MDQYLALLLSLMLGFIPMMFFAAIIYWLDRYEKEPLFLLGGVFIWGAIVAAAGAFITNTLTGTGIFLATHSEELTDLTTGFMVAPFVEESLKGFAVLLIFWMAHSEFDSILDGIVYAAVTALGFAATENAFYIYNFGYLQGGWSHLITVAFIRSVVVGWQHPFYTSFIGIGLAYARLHPNKLSKSIAPILGWLVSIFTHSLHNLLSGLNSSLLCLLSSMIDWSGWIAMFIFIMIMAYREKMLLKQYLREEIDLGNMSARQYNVAQSTHLQIWVLCKSLFKGKLITTSQFYQSCAELSHKKFQFASFGEETGNFEQIELLRDELQRLSPPGFSLKSIFNTNDLTNITKLL